MTDETGGHVPVTRRQWDEHMSAWFDRYARPRWAAAEPYWGIWCIPQSRLPVLPADVAGAVVVELGCGSGYVSAWLARRGARPVGVDVSARQLATARRLQKEFGLYFPLVLGDAERVPLGAGCADLVISEYGASVWCDPYRWIPEGARLLRPGGRLVFMTQSTLAHMCMPEQGPVANRLVRDLFGLHRVVRRGTSGTEYRLFALPHGEWIRLMARCGLMVEDLIEVQVPPGAANNDFPEFPDEWVRRWPAEEVWFARRRSARASHQLISRPGEDPPRGMRVNRVVRFAVDDLPPAAAGLRSADIVLLHERGRTWQHFRGLAATSTNWSPLGASPARGQRQKRATCARPVLHRVADSPGVAPRWSRRAEKEASS